MLTLLKSCFANVVCMSKYCKLSIIGLPAVWISMLVYVFKQQNWNKSTLTPALHVG